MINVLPFVARVPTYAPPWANMDRHQYLRLDLNENTLNPSEHVKEALKRYIDDDRIQMYPDYWQFLPKLAQYAGVSKNQLIVTNGSDQAIEIVLRSFLRYGDEIVMAQPGFPMFSQIAGVIGAKISAVPYYNDLAFPFNEYIDTISSNTKLLVLINPDNPTGASIPLSQIKKVLKLWPDIPVIVDEAYYEFTRKTALEFLQYHSNLIIIRTFSKAFAMAGLRLGYIIAHPEIISQFNKIRGPFDVNSVALIAAEAQIDFPKTWKKYVDETMTVSKPYIESFFNENNVRYYPGTAHFLLVQPKDRDKAVDFLKNNGILVRPMTAPSISNTFRMNVGTLAQTKRFIEVYKEHITKNE